MGQEVASTFSQTEGTPMGLRSASTAEREEAWRALYAHEFDRVYRLVSRFGVSGSEIEDVTQQVFLVAYRRIVEIDELRSVRAWLRGIAVRVVADHHRWRRVRRLKQWLVETTFGEAAVEQRSPERRAEASQTQQQIGAVLCLMSPKLRAVLVLCDIEECSVTEAAAALDVPVNTVRSRRRLARESFQRLWSEARGGDR